MKISARLGGSPSATPAWVLAALLVNITGCESTPNKSVPVPPSSASVTAPAASARHAPDRPGSRHRSAKSLSSGECRALTVSGRVRTGDKSIRSGAPLPPDQWVTLEDKSRASFVSRTGREFTLHGPATVLPCFQAEEVVLISAGRLTTVAGPGARPGASVVLATPGGAVHYYDASLTFTVTASEAQIEVTKGEISVRIPGRESEARKAGQSAKIPIRRSPGQTLSDCEEAAQSAAQLGKQVLKAPKGGLGKVAAAHLVARKKSRLLCAVAAAGAAGVDTKQDFSKRLSRADALWRGKPAP
ncbi:MAG: hypothetical protein HRU17_03580 [Polyangiaceae bacterium]|nr:hypothetical protein [Polyangiaceae bacterium]